ncbi:MAG: hypothetical protein ACI9K5_002133 [Gammaproteobacteria bacterium]|jgi:hypothetical protein
MLQQYCRGALGGKNDSVPGGKRWAIGSLSAFVLLSGSAPWEPVSSGSARCLRDQPGVFGISRVAFHNSPSAAQIPGQNPARAPRGKNPKIGENGINSTPGSPSPLLTESLIALLEPQQPGSAPESAPEWTA